MKLSKNERKFLKSILDDGDISDVKIASELKISPAGVGKIRKNLEEKGIITGYRAEIDYGKLGITTFAIVFVKVNLLEFTNSREKKSLEELLSMPNIMRVYSIPRSTVTHLIVCGFRDVEEFDEHINMIKSNFNKYVTIKEVYVFSDKSILKDSPQGMIQKIIEEWE